MKINPKDFGVPPGKAVNINKWPTIVKPFCKSKEEYQKLLGEHVEKLSSLQHLHYASNRYALLLIDFSRDGRWRQRRRHPARHVRGESARLPGFQFQTAQL